MKLFLLIGFIFFSAFMSGSPDCNDIKLTTTITHTTSGKDNGKIDIEIEKGDPPFSVNLFAEKRENNKLDIKFRDLRALAPGKYILIVQDKGDCTYQETIVIK